MEQHMSTITKANAITQYLANARDTHTYEVSVRGAGLAYVHTEKVTCTTPGEAIDFVAGKLSDKGLTQYACRLLDDKPIKLEAV
jgi:hypothetical protein